MGFRWLLTRSNSPSLPFFAKTGTFAITPQFDDAGSFSEGLAYVIFGEGSAGKVGYIDKQGKLVITPQFVSGHIPESMLNDRSQRDGNHVFRAEPFCEGLAAVRVADGTNITVGYIDKTGKMIIKPQFSYSTRFSEGLAVARVGDENSGKYGYIDKAGAFKINPQYDFAHEFSEGLAEVEVNHRYGYIDHAAKMVAPAISEVGNPRFHEGLALMAVGGREGYFNKDGAIAINPQFPWAAEFSEGLAGVIVGDLRPGPGRTVKWAFIDKTGRIVIDPQFDYAGPFSEGLAPVVINHRTGYIDKSGKFAITPQFDYGASFSQGLAVVRIGDESSGKYGFIDKSGRMVITPTFDSADSFAEGLARVRVGDVYTGKYGFIYR